MVVSSLEGLSDAQKQELVASLSAIVVGASGADVSAESLSAVATASGNSLSGAWASVFATAVVLVRAKDFDFILLICIRDIVCIGARCSSHCKNSSFPSSSQGWINR